MEKQATDQATCKKCKISYDMMNFASNPSLDEIQEVYKRVQKIVEFAFKHLTGNESLSELQIQLNISNTIVPITVDELEIRKLLGIENNPKVGVSVRSGDISISDGTYKSEEDEED